MPRFYFTAERFGNPRPVEHFHEHGKIAFAQRVTEPGKVLLRLIQLAGLAEHKMEVGTFMRLAR